MSASGVARTLEPEGERSRYVLGAGDHLGGADSLQRGDGLGHESRLLFDDGVIDGGAEAFVEDFDAEQFGRSGGSIFVGAGDGDIEGQDLVGIPGESGPGKESLWAPGPILSFS